MNKNIASYIRLNAFLGENILLFKELGSIHCPTIESLHGDFLLYYNSLTSFIEMYDEDNSGFWNNLISTKKMEDFAIFALSFFDADKIDIENTSITYLKTNANMDVIVGVLNESHVAIFIDILKILHHMDNDMEDITATDSKLVREMKERLKVARKKVKETISQKNEIGFIELFSSIAARHPSINPLNIKQLNYFQLIEQFARLGKIDSWNTSMDAVTSGNMSKEGQKEIKHYTSKTDD